MEIVYRQLGIGLLLVLCIFLWTACVTWRTGEGKSVYPMKPESQLSAPPPIAATQVRVQRTYGRLPLSFELNAGQTAEEVEFFARGRGYSLFLSDAEAILTLQKPINISPLAVAEDSTRGRSQKPSAAEYTVLRMRLVGANASPQAEGREELPGVVNYFVGKDPAKWRTNIPTYARVYYRDVYPGVDLVYYGKQGHLEYDFVVAPGTDPSVIRLAFAGGASIEKSAGGSMQIRTAGGVVRMQKPTVYQEINGAKQPVACDFALLPAKGKATATALPARGEQNAVLDQISFKVAAYDPGKPLIIDPVLVYATYLGDSDFDDSNGIAVDSAGNAYVTGETSSPGFPTVNPLQVSIGGGPDAFVVKLNPAGTAPLYSTYLGGSDLEASASIAVDASGNAYVTGRTSSPDFPTANPLQAEIGGDLDAFVVKLNATGTALLYSTFLGGSGRDIGRGLVVDSSGHAYVTGQTSSPDFPTVNPLQVEIEGSIDAFVIQLNATGTTLLYSTFLGGSGRDVSNSISIDSIGHAYVTGQTSSPDFPTVNPLQAVLGGSLDTFVAKLNATGTALLYSTFLGGSGGSTENGVKIAVDAAGNAYVTGWTDAPDFPTVNPLQAVLGGSLDVFVAKLNATGTALLYSTFLGGSGLDAGSSITLDATRNIYVTGGTFSPEFPTANAFQPVLSGSPQDAFVVKLNPTGTALLYSTFLGGNDIDTGLGIAVDAAGNAYVIGRTSSDNFFTPVREELQLPCCVFGDFVTKIAEGESLAVSPSALNFEEVVVGSTASLPLTIQNTGEDRLSGILISPLGPFSILSGEEEFSLEAGASLTVSLGFRPTSAEVFGSVLTIASNGGSANVTLSGVGAALPGPALSVCSTTLDFGQVTLGDSVDLACTVTNSGNGTLQGNAITVSPFSIVSDESFSLDVNQSHILTLRFTAESTDNVDADLTLISNGGDATVRLSGRGIQGPILAVNPTTVNFGGVRIGRSRDLQLTVQNVGGGILNRSVCAPAPFTIPSGTALNIAAGQEQTLTLRFSPPRSNSFNGTMTFTVDACNDLDPQADPVVVVMRGIGVSNQAPGIAYVANRASNTVSVVNTTTQEEEAIIPVGNQPVALALPPNARTLYVVNYLSNDVSVVDTASRQETLRIAVGLNPLEIVISPDGRRAYVANAGPGQDSVSILNLATNQLLATQKIRRPLPSVLALSPDGKVLYVLGTGSDLVGLLDTTTNQVARLTTGADPAAVAFSPDGNRAYVANQGANTVSVLDIRTFPPSLVCEVAVGDAPASVAVTQDGSKVYVANSLDNSLSFFPFFDQCVLGQGIAEGSGPGSAKTTLSSTPLVIPDWQGSTELQIDPNAPQQLLVVNSASNNVGLLDTTTDQAEATIEVGTMPEQSAFDTEQPQALVANVGSNNITMVDTNTASSSPIPVGEAPVALVFSYIDASSLRGFLENPQPNSFQSGIGVISGFVCEANQILIEFDGTGTLEAAYGTSRGDTQGVCDDTNNGFSLLFNWNLLGDGEHTVRALADGVELANVTVTVTTLGLGEFPTGLSGAFTVADFPTAGTSTQLRWQESQQNFVIFRGAGGGGGSAGSVPRVLENPQPGSFQSGIGGISGFVCEAGQILIEFDGTASFEAAYGTSRADTIGVCSDANNGFSLLFNWNLLGDGPHTVRAFADGVMFAEASLTVTTLGLGEFPTGLSGTFPLPNFPAQGQETTVEWQQSQQNFVIVNVQ